ncbi:hypothetical protein K438DRAFT_1990428 [Mycena galopus ATCC 62051]|nr:hypothetical protein K438DRAFT_1990428 [Mycena galopus ATCC 62051]
MNDKLNQLLEYLPKSTGDATPEFSHSGWTDATGQRVLFSLGDGTKDPLAESLACVLHCTNSKAFSPFDELLERKDMEDLLFCDDDSKDDITAEELNARLFGPNSASKWFPYPDKAVWDNFDWPLYF